ncbi:MAG: hypothetical protein JWM11_6122 [Planctomycetaceae bacterium]|nr:hypothetical protein [Planctomycetaceae bacterium]
MQMSMFDWYRPIGILECPVCHSPLREWQGKDGPCALYIWQQGVAAPVDQACEKECQGSSSLMEASRLPPTFTIYSDDCRRHFVAATCKSVDGTWQETFVENEVFGCRSEGKSPG